MKQDRFVIGVDYGTDSVRSVIINPHNGDEVASSVTPPATTAAFPKPGAASTAFGPQAGAGGSSAMNSASEGTA